MDAEALTEGAFVAFAVAVLLSVPTLEVVVPTTCTLTLVLEARDAKVPFKV